MHINAHIFIYVYIYSYICIYDIFLHLFIKCYQNRTCPSLCRCDVIHFSLLWKCHLDHMYDNDLQPCVKLHWVELGQWSRLSVIDKGWVPLRRWALHTDKDRHELYQHTLSHTDKYCRKYVFEKSTVQRKTHRLCSDLTFNPGCSLKWKLDLNGVCDILAGRLVLKYI